jgi:hypothetical protein
MVSMEWDAPPTLLRGEADSWREHLHLEHAPAAKSVMPAAMVFRHTPAARTTLEMPP